ncbi:hypothetical protein N7463_009916 [Penicillium fimorum]|uniref:Hydrophobin n=1 Tax=Penicillium fimorum TaxID=1882269 RepID=A0A9W9XJ13_9EURO|nr:hypothetical protein N7463_009916 [Penicillium fimorum]
MRIYKNCVPFAVSLFLVTPIFGQETLNATDDTGAALVGIAKVNQTCGILACVSMRSEERIHIHVCDHLGSTVRGILDTLQWDNFKTASSVDLSALPRPSVAMSCRASPVSDEDINMGRGIVG